LVICNGLRLTSARWNLCKILDKLPAYHKRPFAISAVKVIIVRFFKSIPVLLLLSLVTIVSRAHLHVKYHPIRLLIGILAEGSVGL